MSRSIRISIEFIFLLWTMVHCGDVLLSQKGEAAVCMKHDDGSVCSDEDSVWSNYHFDADEVIVLTVASNHTEGYQRYLRSTRIYNIKVKTLGFGLKWKGGDMKFAGGGQKINLLREELKSLKSDEANKDKIILFTDSYDLMFLGSLASIIKKFKSFENTRVLFSAEQFCWPDEKLVKKYPEVKNSLNRFLNSGGFIGYLPEIYEIVSNKKIKDEEDDQLYYSQIYVDEKLRNQYKISLDHNSTIFQNLHGAYDEIELHVNESIAYPFIKNSKYNVQPLILHGNGPSKIVFNSLTSYLAKAWSPTLGCEICKEQIKKFDEENLPVVLMSISIDQAVPFIREFFEKIAALNYPKNKIHLLLRNKVEFHTKDIENFKIHMKKYASFKEITHKDGLDEADARNLALDLTLTRNCDYLFIVDAIAHLDDKETLRNLLELNLNVVAPMIVRPEKAWSNFWGALTPEGFYARSVDYMDIVMLSRRGIWNVPFINSCYLINAKNVIKNFNRKQITYKNTEADPDMEFCSSLRQMGIFMYVSNEFDYGHLIDPDTFDITLASPDLYQIFENKWDWEQRYLHPNYSENFNAEYKPNQPCPDVYWFPLMTMQFCEEYIHIMETFGQWSDGSNSDKRLENGYEAVPTRDIHTNQVGFERHWLYILQQYVRPLQELVFTGYFHDPPRSLMNFVVRYKPDEQPNLRPHHDSSTYTINVALNTRGVDYEGGGCHFLRYNCSVVDTKPGWMIMHPGRLTHFHEGLLVTKGVRYIMISFVDP